MSGIRVELELEDGQFTTRMLRAGQSVEDVTKHINQQVVGVKQLDGAYSSLAGTVQRAIVGFASVTAAFAGMKVITTDIISNIVKTNAEFERLTVQMKGMSKAADGVKDAAVQVQFLRDTAAQVPYSLSVIQQAFTRLKAAGIDPTTGSLKALMDAGAASGSTGQEIERASVALAQMSGKGVVQMEELRQQLGEAIPRATELMARGMGITYADLVQKLSKGTVEAKSAIAAMTSEFDRVFGGQAQAQMATFNGQLSLLKTNMATLALSAGGKDTGFFDNVKAQLVTLNSMASSDMAQRLSVSLGQSLNSGLTVISNLIVRIVDARHEIEAVGTVIAEIFGVRAVAAIGAFAVQWMQGVVGNIKIAGAEFRALGPAISAAGAAMQGAGQYAPWVYAVGGAAQFATVGVRALGIAMGVALPLLPVLGIAITAAAQYFDFFGTKAKSAYEELDKYGAVTQKQIQDAQPFIEAEKAKLAAMEATYTRGREFTYKASIRGYKDQAVADFDVRNRDAIAKMAEMRDNIANMEEMLDKRQTELNARQAEAQAKILMGGLQERMSAIQANYDQEQTKLEEHHKAIQKANNDAKKSNEKANAEYGQQTRANQSKLYDEQLKELEDFIQKQQAFLNSGVNKPNEAAGAEKALEDANKKKLELLKAQNQILAMPVGATEISKGLDFDKLYQKGKSALDNLKADIAGLQASIQGADSDAAKLAYQLSQGKFGDVDTQRVKELSAALIQAQEEKSKLDELMTGKTKLENDILQTQIKLQGQIIDLETKGGTEREKILAKVKAGVYSGFTLDADGKIVAKLDQMKGGFGAITQQVTQVSSIIDKTIGTDGISKANTYVTAVDRIAAAWGRVAGAVTGVGSPAAPGSTGGNVQIGPMGSIASSNMQPVAKAFLDAIASVESSGQYNLRYGGANGSKTFDLNGQHPGVKEAIPNDPLGRTSDAAGRYQFLGSTWAAEAGGLPFTPENQDRVAWAYAAKVYKQKTGGDLATDLAQNGLTASMAEALAPTWEGLKVNPNKALAAYKNSINGVGPTQANASATPIGDKENSGVAKVDELQAQLKVKQDDTNLQDDLDAIKKKADAASQQVEGLGKIEAQVVAGILNERFGPDIDPMSKRYENIIAAARRADAEEKTRSENQKARTKADHAAEQQESKANDVASATEMAKRRLADPNGEKYSDGYLQLENQLRKNEELYVKYYGDDEAKMRAYTAENARILQEYHDNEVRKNATTWDEKERRARQATMTAEQIRQDDLRHDLDVLNKSLANFVGTEGEKTALLQKQAALRKALEVQSSMQSPLAKQMKDWSDLGGNMQKAMTGWLDSAADAFGNFVTTGKLDFKSLVDSILKDVAKLAFKSAFSGLMGGGNKSGTAGGGISKLMGTGGSGPSVGGGAAKTGLFGGFHTGGIIGSASPMSFKAPLAAFTSAPRFHTGGIIGADEVPIIAKRGEGVFTEEQMAAMGGSSVMANTVHVTVNAGGGMDQKQGAALGDQVAKAVKQQLQAMMGDEIRKQTRPGGILRS